MKRLTSLGLILIVLLLGFGLSRDIYWRFLVTPIESALVTLCGAVSAGQIFTAAQANCYRTTPANDYNGNITDANVSATAAIAKSKISTASTWVRADLPSQLAYEDEVNIFALGTITTDQPIFNGTATWNAGGITFNGIKTNITDTASASASKLLDLQVGGVSKISVDKSGNASIAGTYQSTKACATGFIRVTGAGNYCQRNTGGGSTWTDATACTSRTTGLTLPADTKLINIKLSWVANANNAIGLRDNGVTFHPDSLCANIANTSKFRVQEFAATTAGTNIGEFTDHLIVPLVSTDTFYTTQSNAGGNGNAEIFSYFIEGYWD